jgi:hypothetical protein
MFTCPHNVICTDPQGCRARSKPCGHRPDQAYPCCIVGFITEVDGVPTADAARILPDPFDVDSQAGRGSAW